MIMDKVSAWAELERFADACEVELDDRAHPKYKVSEDPDAEANESEVSDYDALIKALQKGHMLVSPAGALEIVWSKPPRNGEENASLKLDPDPAGDGWQYGHALRAYSAGSDGSPRNKAHRNIDGDDSLGRLDLFVETLAEEPVGTLQSLRSRRDRNLVTVVGRFVLTE